MNKIIFKQRECKSSCGDEIYISFETEACSQGYKEFPELYQAALIRGAHVYGVKQGVNKLKEKQVKIITRI